MWCLVWCDGRERMGQRVIGGEVGEGGREGKEMGWRVGCVDVV